MDSNKKFNLYILGMPNENTGAKQEKTLEFDSLAAAEDFFWKIIKIPFLREEARQMILYQGDVNNPKDWILDFGGFEYITANKSWLKKPYNKEEMQINHNGDIVKSNAWTKKEYEWAISQAKDKKTIQSLTENMNKQYPQNQQNR